MKNEIEIYLELEEYIKYKSTDAYSKNLEFKNRTDRSIFMLKWILGIENNPNRIEKLPEIEKRLKYLEKYSHGHSVE